MFSNVLPSSIKLLYYADCTTLNYNSALYEVVLLRFAPMTSLRNVYIIYNIILLE